MKLKAPKINDVTLFVYKPAKQVLHKSETDTTTMITTMMTTSSGIYHSEKNWR